MLLSEHHLAVPDAVRTFVRERIAPLRRVMGQEPSFSARGVAGAGRARLLRRGGARSAMGAPGSTTWRWRIILEEIAAGDGATSTIVSVNNCPVCSILMAFGNDEQKTALSCSRWLAATCWARSASPSRTSAPRPAA